MLFRSGQHANANDAIEAIESTLGTTAGTAVIDNFSAGERAIAIAGTATLKNVDSILDEDDMASDSATALATQQSIAAAVCGWLKAGINGVTVTRESTDNPTVVLRFDADVRDYIWKGTRIKATENSIVHYFIVSADPTDDSGDTLVTCLSEINTSTPTQAKNLIGTGTISDVAYAPPKTYPKGFPIDTRSWDIWTRGSSPVDISSPSTGVYYEAYSLVVPIGDWNLSYSAAISSIRNSASNNGGLRSVLSNANNTAAYIDTFQFNFVASDEANVEHVMPVRGQTYRTFTSKQTVYLNLASNGSASNIKLIVLHESNPIIRATSTLL